jgi:hypothetical protein
MKILFLARHFSYLRNFDSAIRELARRGHTLHLSADREESMGGRRMVERIAETYPNVTVGWTPTRESGAWYELAGKLRLGLDYLRFLEPRYASTPHLLKRARTRAPLAVVSLAAMPPFSTRLGRRFLTAVLRGLERGVPRSPEIDAFVRAQQPDVVLITPLIDLGSPQADHFASARAAGVRTALAVGSWDHLSSKSLLKHTPDGVLVWNEVQKREATEMHGVPPELVTVTGAQSYDHWFGRAPSRPRREFCTRVGLDPDKPFVLWVCSSLFRKTAYEADVVERWVEAVRTSSDPALRDAGILIRPHPARLDEWANIDLSGYRNLVFWGAHPVDDESKDDYFDSMYYSAAIVGLNTSAFLEAGIVGRPVYSILLPEVSPANQEGTIHFHYLLTVNGGLLHTSRSIEEHTAQLAAGLRASAASGVVDDPKSRRFTEGFIRPFGLDQPASPRFADAVERLAQSTPVREPVISALGGGLMRLLLFPWLTYMHAKVSSQPWRKEMRYKTRRAVKHYSKRFWLQLKTYAAVKIKGSRSYEGRRAPATGAQLTPKLGKPRDPSKSLSFPGISEVDETRETITMLGRQRRPIIVGPWLTETGFELLYWIPFLRWAKTYGGLRENELIIVSRGGCQSWYRDIGTRYFDVLSLYSPDEFRRLNDERAAQNRGRFKHMDVSEFDQTIIDRVTATLGLDKPALLHPSLMYNLFNVYWKQMAPVTLIEAFTSFGPLPPVTLGDLAPHLPERYVAVKFYSNVALPDSPDNRALVAAQLRELTAHTDVVMLHTGQRFDDHTEYPIDVRSRIHTIDHLMTPDTNLDVQTRVIAGAEAFVGTYGGFSYLAPLVGTDALAFYSHAKGFRWDHLELAKRVFNSVQAGSFVALDARDMHVVRLGFGHAGAASPSRTEAASAEK